MERRLGSASPLASGLGSAAAVIKAGLCPAVTKPAVTLSQNPVPPRSHEPGGRLLRPVPGDRPKLLPHQLPAQLQVGCASVRVCSWRLWAGLARWRQATTPMLQQDTELACPFVHREPRAGHLPSPCPPTQWHSCIKSLRSSTEALDAHNQPTLKRASLLFLPLHLTHSCPGCPCLICAAPQRRWMRTAHSESIASLLFVSHVSLHITPTAAIIALV